MDSLVTTVVSKSFHKNCGFTWRWKLVGYNESEAIILPGSKSYRARADGLDWAAGGGALTVGGAALGGALGCALTSVKFKEFSLPLFSNFGREMKERSARGRLAASDNLKTNKRIVSMK